MFIHFVFIGNNWRAAWSVYTAFGRCKESAAKDWRLKFYDIRKSIDSASQEAIDFNVVLESGGEKHSRASSTFDEGRDLHFDDVAHCIILPNYKEDLGTLRETLSVLASHAWASRSYWVHTI